MIGTLAVSNTAFRQNVKLQTFYAFLGSPSNIRVRDLPAAIGDWELDAIYVKVNYPDNNTYTVECTNVDDIWVGTVPASTMIGISQNGYQIVADGIDEKGSQRTGYVLGAGDLEILDSDNQTAPGEHQILLSLKDGLPESPRTGDIAKDTDGLYKIYQNDTWNALGQTVAIGQWGNIQGNLSSQTDLKNALDDKVDVANLSETYYFEGSGIEGTSNQILQPKTDVRDVIKAGNVIVVNYPYNDNDQMTLKVLCNKTSMSTHDYFSLRIGTHTVVISLVNLGKLYYDRPICIGNIQWSAPDEASGTIRAYDKTTMGMIDMQCYFSFT